MKLSEVLTESQIDEIGLRGAFKTAGLPGAAAAAGRGVGRLAKGISSTWQAAKKGFQMGAGGTARQRARAGAAAPASGGTASTGISAGSSTAGTAAAAGASSGEFDQLKAAISKLSPEQKQELSAEIEKSKTAQPADGAADLDQLKQQAAAQRAAGQAQQSQAVQQMKATQQANAEKAQQDAEIKSAADAAKAKPGFQQTAADKLAIKRAQDAGIREEGLDEAAPAFVRGAAGLAAGGLAAAGTPGLIALLGPVIGLGVGAAGAYNASKYAMAGADALWDKAVEIFKGEDQAQNFAIAHLKAAAAGEKNFNYGTKTFPVTLKPNQVKTAINAVSKVTESVITEGWKEKLMAAGLAGAIALGSASGAMARTTPGDDDPGVNRLTGKPNVTQTQQGDTAKQQGGSNQATAGFSKEYLQKAADPNRFGRYLISVEKAQELLQQYDAKENIETDRASVAEGKKFKFPSKFLGQDI